MSIETMGKIFVTVRVEKLIGNPALGGEHILELY